MSMRGPCVKVWTSCAQWQCTCVEHKNGYEVRLRSPRTLLSHSGATGSHTKALPQLQSDQMIDNRSKYVQCFFAHHPIAHILISVKILMNRIIIKTHWAEVRRAGYKRNPSHETWAQLASQRAAHCAHCDDHHRHHRLTKGHIVRMFILTTDTIMPKSQCHHFNSTIFCLYISYSYLEFAFWDLFL